MRLHVVLLLAIAASVAAAPATGQEPNPLERVEAWPDGAVKVRYTVDAEGKRHGTYEEWAQNGTRTRTTAYVHGLRQGAHREWTATGAKVNALQYEADLLHGHCETFHDNGRVASSGSYREGQRTGKWLEVDASGERRRTAEYRLGKLHGPLRIQWKTRTLTRQTWRDGELVLLDDLVPFPVPRTQLLAELRALLATPAPAATDADPKAPLRHAALLRLRAYRHLCGLPEADMELVPAWNVLCDAAAEVCRRNGKIDHRPPQPPGFDEARYRQGAEGARNSNLATGGSLVSSVDQYMDDSDPSNIDRIGHRRWCLNPAMRKVGFGTDERFHAMWSMDASGSAPKGLDAVYYPPRGFVPVDLFASHRAFSISMLRGGAPKADELRASIRVLDDDYLAIGDPLGLDHCHIAAGGFGAGTCLVFRAPEIEVAAGRRYLVEVSTDAGKTLAFRYVVEFVEAVGDGR